MGGFALRVVKKLKKQPRNELIRQKRSKSTQELRLFNNFHPNCLLVKLKTKIQQINES